MNTYVIDYIVESYYMLQNYIKIFKNVKDNYVPQHRQIEIKNFIKTA